MKLEKKSEVTKTTLKLLDLTSSMNNKISITKSKNKVVLHSNKEVNRTR
jgi:hypothetical protein